VTDDSTMTRSGMFAWLLAATRGRVSRRDLDHALLLLLLAREHEALPRTSRKVKGRTSKPTNASTHQNDWFFSEPAA